MRLAGARVFLISGAAAPRPLRSAASDVADACIYAPPARFSHENSRANASPGSGYRDASLIFGAVGGMALGVAKMPVLPPAPACRFIRIAPLPVASALSLITIGSSFILMGCHIIILRFASLMLSKCRREAILAVPV